MFVINVFGNIEFAANSTIFEWKIRVGVWSKGQRRKKYAAAHYESAKVVINLTKNKGAGNLGHEWFHSLDNYFGRQERNITSAMATANSEGKSVEKISPEVQETFQLVRRVINQSGILERSKKFDGRRSKIYWTLPDEIAARAFEVI